MKKLLMVTLALALVFSISPKAEAEESAALNLEVTFSLEPLEIWTEPKGPFKVIKGETLEFRLIYEDKDSLNVSLSGITVLPEGAEYIPDDEPSTANHREGTFRWTPKIGELYLRLYRVCFMVENAEGDQKALTVEITVSQRSIISIELNDTAWLLQGVTLGERRSNFDDNGLAMHKVKNTGNVPAMVDIGYGPYAIDMRVHPGKEQGLDAFITIITVRNIEEQRNIVIPPNRRIILDSSIEPDEEKELPLTYGAPTALSEPVQGMGTTYELRAYPAFLEEPINPEPVGE